MKKLYNILIQDFNICFFIGLIILSIYPELTTPFFYNHGWLVYITIPSISGTITALIILFMNKSFFNKRYTQRYHANDTKLLLLVSFSAGFMSVYITLFNWSIYIISSFIIYISALNIKKFIGQLSQLLSPNMLATKEDLSEFANFFINLIITFSVVNLSVNTIHQHFSAPDAFNFGAGTEAIINALYFSIITLTTVGYGHIIPQNEIARIFVSIECLTGYLLLGLMIGIITRGIKLSNKE